MLRRTALALLTVAICGWISLYLDSVHQRRRAERLISDLKSFPFATASFSEVRKLAERSGGAPIEQFPLVKFPMYGTPSADSKGRVQMPVLEGGDPTCTIRECVFRIWIQPWPLTFKFEYPAGMILRSALAYVGLRPWGMFAEFEVRDGKLDNSRTVVGQIRNETTNEVRGLFTSEYEIVSNANREAIFFSNGDYFVGSPHVTGPPTELLRTYFLQTSKVPTQRAFDVDVRCVTEVWRSCRGLRELAPHAWADHNHEVTK